MVTGRGRLGKCTQGVRENDTQKKRLAFNQDKRFELIEFTWKRKLFTQITITYVNVNLFY